MTWSCSQFCFARWWRTGYFHAAFTLIFLVLPAGLAGCQTLPAFWPGKTEPTNPTTPDPAPAPARAEAPKPIRPMEPQEKPPTKYKRWEWAGTDHQISHIWIDVDSQKARFYEGTKQVGWTYIASGIQSYPTPVGRFTVIGKEKVKESNLYGKIYDAEGKVVKTDAKRGRDPVPPGGRFSGAKMPYFLRLTGDGVGLHAGPIPRPGRPASHGCVRLPPPVASKLFIQAPIGTPVTITGSGPDYGDYQVRLAAKGPDKQEPPEGGTLSAAETAASQSGSGILTQAGAKVETAPANPSPAIVHPLVTEGHLEIPVPGQHPNQPSRPTESESAPQSPPRPRGQ